MGEQEPLSTLELWATSCFGGTPNRAIERPRVPPFSAGPPIEPSRLPTRLTVRPLEQTRFLCLGWYLPSQLASRDHTRCKPTDLIGHLLGHEGKGGVLSYLKALGVATGHGKCTLALNRAATLRSVIQTTAPHCSRLWG